MTAPHLTTTRWTQVLLAYGCGVVAAGQLGLVPPLVPALQRDLAIGLTAAGLAISLITCVGAALGLAAGAWAERIGHARALWLGLALMALAAVLCAVAPGGPTLLAGRGLAGTGYLLVVVAAPSLIADAAAPRDQAAALALWGTFVPAGVATAQALAAHFAGDLNWRGLFWADAALLAVMLVVVILGLPHRPAVAPSTQAPSVLRDRPALLLASALFCFALTFLALAGLLPAYLVQARGFTEVEAGRIVAAATSGGIAGSVLAGWQMRRGRRPSRLAATGLLAANAITLLIFPLLAPTSLALIAAAASFVIGGLVPAAIFAGVPRLAAQPAAIGPLNGLVAQLGSLGSLVGPPLLAAWVTVAGWEAAPVLLLAAALAGGLCLRGVAAASRGA